MKFLVMDLQLDLKLITPAGDQDASEEEVAALRSEIENSAEFEVLRSALQKAMSSIPGVTAETGVRLIDVGIRSLQ